MMENGDDNTESDESASWLGALRDIGGGLAEEIGSMIAEEGEGALVGRWMPVARAGRDVLGSFAELGWYLGRRSFDEVDPPDELIENLSERTEALIASFPNVATLYEDVGAFDRRFRVGLDKAGSDATLFAYLDWLRGFVEAVIERAVDISLDDDNERRLSPERAAEFLERVDEILEIVLQRWVFPAVIDPGPRQSDES